MITRAFIEVVIDHDARCPVDHYQCATNIRSILQGRWVANGATIHEMNLLMLAPETEAERANKGESQT